MLYRAHGDRVGGDAGRLRRRPASRSHAEAHEAPGLVTSVPVTAPVRRLDEVAAACWSNLRWRPVAGMETPCPE